MTLALIDYQAGNLHSVANALRAAGCTDLTVTADPVEFLAWAVLAGVVQVVTAFVIRRFVVRDLTRRIEEGNVATGLYAGATSIAVGLINAASMTY